MSKINLTVEEINALKVQRLLQTKEYERNFVQIYDTMWANTTGVSGDAAYERESRFLIA